MNPLTAIDRLTHLPLDLADHLADTAGDLEESRGGPTLATKALKAGSNAAYVVAFPLAVINLLLTGTIVRRAEDREIAKVAKAQG